MCMITYLEPGIDVPEEGIINGATWNDDGHGWAIAAETGVMLTGHYMDAEIALATFKLTREAYPDAYAMFHSRFATHGTVGLVNVHPFKVGKYAVVSHNGILPVKFHPQHVDDTRSDTAILAGSFLPGRTQVSGIWTRKERRRIGNIIGIGNKLAILSVSPYLDSPRGYLINSHMGQWDNGVWFSNGDYRNQWRARYATSHTSNDFGSKGAIGGAWMWDDDGYGWHPVSDKEIAAKRVQYGVCPLCADSKNVDRTSNICLRCDTCLDCLEPCRACTCYFDRESIRANTDTPSEDLVSDNPAIVQRAMIELEGRHSSE